MTVYFYVLVYSYTLILGCIDKSYLYTTTIFIEYPASSYFGYSSRFRFHFSSISVYVLIVSISHEAKTHAMGIPVNILKTSVSEKIMWTVAMVSGPVVGLDGDGRWRGGTVGGGVGAGGRRRLFRFSVFLACLFFVDDRDVADRWTVWSSPACK